MIVTFAGHRDVTDSDAVRSWLCNKVEQLIQHGANTFYNGGYGAFDSMAASVVKEMKEKYPSIESVLVTPYLDRANTYSFDASIYPELENVPKRLAIVKRNEWIVDNSDVLIAYVTRDFGGAYKTLKYARRKKKKVIAYPD